MYVGAYLPRPSAFPAGPFDPDFVTSTFGELPPIIGFTGRRNTGKSTAVGVLEAEFDFQRVHPVGALKAGWKRWLSVVTGDATLAERMVYGDLKDTPSEYLPNNATPRFYFEKHGKFQADLGHDWTIGIEFQILWRSNPRARIAVESVAHEAHWLRRRGAVIVRLERPGFISPVADETDAAVANIAVDHVISATDVDELRAKVRQLAQQIVGGR